MDLRRPSREELIEESNRRLIDSGRSVDGGRLIIEESRELIRRTREDIDRRKASERRGNGGGEQRVINP